MLQVKQGEKFQSATDTEVIPKLCRYVYKNLSDKVSFSEVCSCSSNKNKIISA